MGGDSHFRWDLRKSANALALYLNVSMPRDITWRQLLTQFQRRERSYSLHLLQPIHVHRTSRRFSPSENQMERGQQRGPSFYSFSVGLLLVHCLFNLIVWVTELFWETSTWTCLYVEVEIRRRLPDRCSFIFGDIDGTVSLVLRLRGVEAMVSLHVVYLRWPLTQWLVRKDVWLHYLRNQSRVKY